MDNLIPILFLLIFIISIVSKLKPKKRTGAGAGEKPARSGSLVGRLNTFLADVQKKLEEEAAAARRQGRGSDADLSEWSQLVDAEDVEVRQGQTPDDSLEDLVLEEVAPVTVPRPTRRPTPPPVRTTTLERYQRPPIPQRLTRPAPPAQPAPQSARRAGTVPEPAKRVSRAALRRAIVWSEILGPPVALRDPGGDR